MSVDESSPTVTRDARARDHLLEVEVARHVGPSGLVLCYERGGVSLVAFVASDASECALVEGSNAIYVQAKDILPLDGDAR